MVWQNPKDIKEPGVELAGPKTLRSNLVREIGNGRKVDVQDLETLEVLGQGAYGTVHKVQEKATGQCRVLKTVLRPEGWDDQKLKMEAELLRHLDHPHILRIFNWYEDGDAINIVLEHCEGGELLKLVKKGRRLGVGISEKWLATAIRQTFEALVYLHSKGVVHKDLKGQNILLLNQTENDDTAKIFETLPHVVVCDLGIAEVCCRGIFGMRGRRVAGTPCTMAPEVWRGTCGPRSDVWSMGCVMFELFTGKLPFEVTGGAKAARQQEKWLEQHRRGPNWLLMAGFPQAMSLCRALLVIKEAARPSAVECLKHPWFNLCDENPLSDKETAALCHAMLTYRRRNPMQRALCLKMAVGSPCIGKFAKVFTKFDKDHSGILDRTEVIAALQQLGIDRSTAKKAAAALDINGDNSCEYLEFVSACLFSLEGQFDELLRQEFRALDKKGKGSLSPQEFELLMDELRPIAESRGLFLANIDSDGDGVISFAEFCSYFGRPGVAYTHGHGKPAAAQNGLPMKQHIRIMHTHSLDAIHSATFEATPKSPTSPLNPWDSEEQSHCDSEVVACDTEEEEEDARQPEVVGARMSTSSVEPSCLEVVPEGKPVRTADPDAGARLGRASSALGELEMASRRSSRQDTPPPPPQKRGSLGSIRTSLRNSLRGPLRSVSGTLLTPPPEHKPAPPTTENSQSSRGQTPESNAPGADSAWRETGAGTPGIQTGVSRLDSLPTTRNTDSDSEASEEGPGGGSAEEGQSGEGPLRPSKQTGHMLAEESQTGGLVIHSSAVTTEDIENTCSGCLPHAPHAWFELLFAGDRTHSERDHHSLIKRRITDPLPAGRCVVSM